MVIYSIIQVKMGLISKPIFDYTIMKTIAIRSATLLHISVHFCLSVSVSLWHVDILYGTYLGPFLAFPEGLLPKLLTPKLLTPAPEGLFWTLLYKNTDSIQFCWRSCSDWCSSFSVELQHIAH